jgi:hypothetical protein
VPQLLHVLGHSVGRTLTAGKEIILKITQKVVVDVLERHVVQVVPVHDETGKVSAGIATVVIRGLYRIDAYHFLSFRIAPVEQLQQCLVFGFDTEKNVFDFLGGNIVVPFLQFSIYLVYRCFGIIDKGVDFDGVRRPSGCLARLYIPMFGIYIAFHSETRFLSVNGYPAKKRNHTVGFLFVSFHVGTIVKMKKKSMSDCQCVIKFKLLINAIFRTKENKF